MRGILFLLLLVLGLVRALPLNGTVGGATPVSVYISVVPVQVSKVDVTVQNVFFDAYVTLSWQDESVVECGPGGSGFPPAPSDWTAWSPAAEFVNHFDDGTGSREFKQSYCGMPFAMLASGAPSHLAAENWTNFYGRITGTFVAQMQMSDFPQDTQTVVLQIESDTHDASALAWEFVPLPSQQVEFKHTGWYFRGAGFEVAPHYYAAFDLTYAKATFQLRLQRDARYYFTRYVLNIMLLVALSLLGAILSPLETSRIMLSVTLFLGVVSWMFVLVVDAPKSDQPTRMDTFFLASFLVLLLQALYFTVRNHNYDATLAPLPFWKRWLDRGGGGRSRAAPSRSIASSHESPPSEEEEERGAAAPGLPPTPDLAPDAPQPLEREEAAREGKGEGGGRGRGGRKRGRRVRREDGGADEGEARAARSGSPKQQEAEFVTERVRESVVVNTFLMVAYGAWVAYIFLRP